MADTQGYSVVVEASEGVLRKVIRGAWKSAECPEEPGDTGRIPEFMQIPAGESFGGFVIADGSIQIPQDELDASLRPDVSGAEIKLGILIQVEIENPPVPSAQMLTMTADLRAAAPIGQIPGRQDVGWLLDGMARGSVSATLTSGDPIESRIELFAGEFVDKAYENGGPSGPIDPAFPVIPHVMDETDKSFAGGALVTDVHAEIFNDAANPAHKIVTTVAGGQIHISLPLYLRMFDIQVSDLVALVFDPADPMGIETRITLSAPFGRVGSEYRADLTTATVTVDPIAPAGAEYGDEGPNYIANRDQLGSLPIVSVDLEAGIQNELRNRGQELAADIGVIGFLAPTAAEIEAFIGDFFHEDIEARDFIYIWGPEATDEEFAVDDITVAVTSEFLAIALNDMGGADASGLANFVPADRDFAIAISAQQVDASIQQAREEAELAEDDLPKTFTPDGREVRLKKGMSVTLRPGAIRIAGEVTVVDAILGSIDVDADFFTDVGLRWEPNGALNSDGGQRMEHFEIASDVDPEESVLLWVVTVILAVITLGAFGILGALVVVIVALVVRGIAENMGSSILSDEVTDTVTGITAWPETLARIGRVEAVFFDPIVIAVDGLELAGDFEVISSCEATAVVPADAGGDRSVDAASALVLAALNEHPDATYEWLFGDGSAASALPSISHVYAASGVYTAKHALRVNQPGGAFSRSFALVSVRNIPPTVDAGPDLTVNEGEEVTLTARFRDEEYPDTHESMWYFGDHQAPKPGTIAETNTPPAAVGTSTVTHAWCDNGDYTVTVRIRDVNGGEGIDTVRVRVLNVPPVVEAGPDMYAYVCMAITLSADFTDPGWCDTHVAQWDFGDCGEPRTAIVEEINEPPATVGVAYATHIYTKCGDFRAVCTVRDDDGAFGQDELTVRVVHLLNPGFEDGFRNLATGNVGRFWTPYAQLTDLAALIEGKGKPIPTEAPLPANAFACEECVVHDGRKSQRVSVLAGRRLGLWQRLGANPGWDYEFAAWFTLAAPHAGTCALGIDPAGGSDPGAPGVLWWTGSAAGAWRQLAGRVTAEADAVTIFVEIVGGDRRLDALGYIDDVSFVAIQPHCPEPPEEEPVPPQTTRCVDFDGLKLPSRHTLLNIKGVSFRPGHGQVLYVAPHLDPVGRAKLMLTMAGVEAVLPVEADYVKLTVTYAGGKPVEVRAFDAAANLVTSATGDMVQGVQVIELAGSGIRRLVLRAQEGALIELCFRPERDGGREPREPEPGPGFVVNPRFDRGTLVRVGATGEEGSGVNEEMSDPAYGLTREEWAKFDATLRERMRDAEAGRDDATVKALVRLSRLPGAAETAPAARQAAFRARVRPLVTALRRMGASDITELWLVDGLSASLPAEAAAALARDPSVQSISSVATRNALPEKR